MNGENRTDFSPAWWLRGAHLQTVWGRLARSRTQVPLRREALTAKAEDLVRRFPEAAERIDLPRARRAYTFREFDAAATAPLHGFAGADDYYARSSSLPFLQRITTPTRCVLALDDPFLPPEATRRARDAASSAVRFVVTDRGGHAGFVSAHGLTPVYLGEELVIDSLARLARGDDSPDAQRSAA